MFFIYLIFILFVFPFLDANEGTKDIEMTRPPGLGQGEEQEQLPQHQEVATGTLLNEGLFGIAQGIQNRAPIQSPVENEGNTIQIDHEHINRRFQGHNHHRIRNHRNNNQNPCCTIL
uniref:Secreted protein n=1 Tax=Meloidogyne incognita TaxID=6306 RepID=A0A914LLX4_MELIC